MGESKEERIARLVREGLDHYGADEIPTAILLWEEALELDPNHVEATDYLRNEERRRRPRPPKEEKKTQALTALLQEVRTLMTDENYAGAYELLHGAAGPGIAGLEYEASVDLVRSRLYHSYCKRFGDFIVTEGKL